MSAAYDYHAQRWVEGNEATAQATSQLTETIETLQGERGEEYARFIGKDRGEALQEAREALRAWQH